MKKPCKKEAGLYAHTKMFTDFWRTPFSSAFSQFGMRQETPQKWRYLELEMIALKKDVDENGEKLLLKRQKSNACSS